MEPTWSNFTLIAYIVPFGSFPIIFAIVSIVNRRSNWFLLKNILGLERTPDDTSEIQRKKTPKNEKPPIIHQWCCCDKSCCDDGSNSSTENSEPPIQTYLNIHFDEDNDNTAPLHCCTRFFSDILMSAILAVFLSILFLKLVLSNDSIATGKACPDYDAYCFATKGDYQNTAFNCTKGQNANFSTNSSALWCVGWVYQDVSAQNILDALGVCGGLLGLVAGIVPLVYYLTYSKYYWISLVWIILPLAPLVGIGLMIKSALTIAPSQLAWTVVSLVAVMTWIGWIWALARSCQYNDKQSNETTRKDERKCCCRVICWRSYKAYPWKFCSDCIKNLFTCTC